MRRGAEFSVFQAASPSRRTLAVPTEAGLRKPRSLSNLPLQGATEPGAEDPDADMVLPRGGTEWEGLTGASGATRARSLSLSLFRVLSAPESSPPLGAPMSLRCQRGEVSGPEWMGEGTDEESSGGRSDDEGPSRVAALWAEDEEGHGCVREGAAHLDRDVILTMLGDLKQALSAPPRRKCHLISPAASHTGRT